MTSNERLPLFVFGTLRRGRRNHALLAGRYGRMLPARLPGFRRIHPLMIAPSPGDDVEGELYFPRPEVYEETLRDCDHLEGLPAGRTVGEDYRRMPVTVRTAEGTFKAWAYVHPETEESEIESG